MSPCATPATQSAAAPATSNGPQARHQCHKCHACHTRRRSMSTSARPPTQNEGRRRQVRRQYTKRRLTSKRGPCHAKQWWMSPSATPATQSAAATIGPKRATKSSPVPQVPRLTKCHACHATPATPATPRLPRKVPRRHRCVTKLCVKGGVWQSCVWQSCVWQMVCDKVVCESWCVTKLCVCDKVVCVWQSCVWKMVCNKIVCVTKLCVWKMVGVWQSCVCERWCVTKLCVKDGVWQRCVCERWCVCVWQRWGRGGGGRRDTEPKTRTPHKDVGKKKRNQFCFSISQLNSVSSSYFNSWGLSRKRLCGQMSDGTRKAQKNKTHHFPGRGIGMARFVLMTSGDLRRNLQVFHRPLIKCGGLNHDLPFGMNGE